MAVISKEKRARPFIASCLCLSATLAATPAFATDTITAGAASIGSVAGDARWWGLWPTQFAGTVWNNYTIIGSTQTNNTYVNAQPGGSIIFRSNNAGTLGNDPDQSSALGWIDNSGIFHSSGLNIAGPIIAQRKVDAYGDIDMWTGSLTVLKGEIYGRGKGVKGAVAPSSDLPNSPRGAVMGFNQFSSSDAFGVYGSGGGGGLSGETLSGTGVLASSVSGSAFSGTPYSSYGLFASSNTGIGVYGGSTSSYGVQGVSGGSKYAGYFLGTTNGAYGKGTTYGVYSDGPIYVNSPTTTKVSGSGTWAVGSDARIKKNVADFPGGLAELERVRPVRFQYNGLGETANDGSEFVGVIAQELEPVAPYMVSKAKRKLHPGDKEPTDIRQVDPNAFIYMLINSVKQLSRENHQLVLENREFRAESTEVRRLLCASHRADAWCSRKLAALQRR